MGDLAKGEEDAAVAAAAAAAVVDTAVASKRVRVVLGGETEETSR